MRARFVCSVLVAGSMAVFSTAIAQARDMVHPEIGVAPAHVHLDLHARHQHHFGVFAPFGFVDGFVDDGGQGFVAAGPPEIVLNAPAFPESQADRPPCHEITPEGVTIDRGLGCKRAAR